MSRTMAMHRIKEPPALSAQIHVQQEENYRRKTRKLEKEIQPFSIVVNIAKFWTNQRKWHFFFFKLFYDKVPQQ